MEIKQGVKMHNRFDVEVRDARTGQIKQEAKGYNIILDKMYTRLCGGSSYFTNIHFGTGTGTLSPTRTSLFSHLGTKSAVTEELTKALPTSMWKRKITLNPEEYVGEEITEVGIAYGSTSSYLVTHAMLEDAEGNPISILKTATDVVIIYATVYITLTSSYPTLYYYSAGINSLIGYLTGGSAPTGSFGLKPILWGIRLGSTSNVSWISDVANRQRKTNVMRFGTTVGNGHAQVLDFTNIFELKLPTENVFDGQPYEGVPIGVGDGVKDTFDIPSYNIQADALTVKVNGVAVEAYALKSMPAFFELPIYNIPGRGSAVSLSADGTVLALASGTTSPYVTVWDWAEDAWSERSQPDNVPSYGQRVSLSGDGTVLALASGTVSPYLKVWDWAVDAWTERPQPPNVLTNQSVVSLSGDGGVLALGSYTTAPYANVWTSKEATAYRIKFDTAPAEDDVITADYTVNGLHKTDQYVVDVSMAIQFGEGV